MYDGGDDPLQALLKGALGQQAACQLQIHLQDTKKGSWGQIRRIVNWGDILTPIAASF